jgi:hypothetical protein
MFSRRKLSPPLFVGGLGLMGWGISDDVTPLWVAGIVVFAVGLAVLAKRAKA